MPIIPTRETDATANDVLAQIAEALAPAVLPATQRSRMRERIRRETTSDHPPAGTHTWRSADSGWVDGLPGVRLRLLRVDAAAGTQEVLVRLLPGGIVPAHSHTKEEQMVIIDGTVLVGDHRLGPGDVHVAAPGTTHAALTSAEGALLLLRCEHPFPTDR